jgi:D-xylose transport system substrate-binding protein
MRGLAGKIPVSGQDADLAACQRIVRGTQSMTVYKPVRLLATRAAEAAVALGRKQSPCGCDHTVSNGRKNVPSLLFEPIVVDQKNLFGTVIADGFHEEREIYMRG